MSFRITMGMKMNTYRYNLMQSTNTLYNSQEKVQTNRKFNSYAEAPADATHAWRVRREYMANASYRRNNDDTYTRYQTAWLTMGSFKTNLEDKTGREAIIRAENGATGEAKKQLGDVLSNTADTIIQAMNSAKYGDVFVFSGTNGTDAPFEWQGGSLTYRGVSLNSPGGTDWPASWGALDEDTSLPENFDTLFPATATATEVQTAYNGLTDREKEWYSYFQNVRTLNELSEEKQYADLGMGMQMDGAGNMIDTTVFNNALPGIKMLGYGIDADGDPKNVVLIMKEMNELLQKVDSNGNFPTTDDERKAERLLDKFNAASDLTLKGYSEIDTKAKFLQANKETLEDQSYNLTEEIINLEQVDMADAITAFMWDYTCYNAGLKIGTQLLGQSLLDYMR